MAITPCYCCGFECGTSGHFSFFGGASFSTTTVHPSGGSRSLRINVSSAVGRVDIPLGVSTNTYVGRVYINFATLPSVDDNLFCVGGTSNGLWFKNSDSTIRLGSAGTLGSSGVSVTTGTWYRLDLRINASANPWVLDANVNGTALPQFTIATAAASNTVMNLGGTFAAATYDIFYDHLIIGTVSADFPIGDGKVLGFVPASDGTHTSTSTNIVKGTTATPVGAAITSATTDSFNWVNDRPMLGGATDNTRLINQQTASSAQYVEHGIEQTTETNAPRTVEVLVAYLAAGTQGCVAAYKINDNGTENTVKSITAGVTTDTYAHKHYVTMPADVQLWTLARFKALKLRFGYSSDATPDVYLRGWFVEAEWAVSSGTQYTQAVNGTLQFAGAVTKQDQKALSGGLTLTGVRPTMLVSVPLTANLSLVGAVTKFTQRAITGTLSFIGGFSASKIAFKTLTGTLTMAGAITQRNIGKALTGTLTFSGTLTKFTSRILSGTLSMAGSVVKNTSRTLTGALSVAGNLSKRTLKALTGTLTLSGAITKRAVGALLTGTLTLSGSVTKFTSRALTGTLTVAGATLKTTNVPLAGTLTMAGTITKRTGKALTGSLTFAGAMTRKTLKALTGTLTFSGILNTLKSGGGNLFTLSLNGTLSMAGSISKVTQKALSGTLKVYGFHARPNEYFIEVTSPTSTADEPYGLSSSPHAFVMSDGAWVVFHWDNAIQYSIRMPNGTVKDPVNTFSHPFMRARRNGDTIYTASFDSIGSISVNKFVYSAGSITWTAAQVASALLNAKCQGFYYDPVNDLLHVHWYNGTTGGSFVEAWSGSTLTFQYRCSDLTGGGLGTNVTVDPDLTDMDGNGADFINVSLDGTTYKFIHFVAGPSSYTTQTIEGTSAKHGSCNYVTVRWDGTYYQSLIVSHTSTLEIWNLTRTAANTYSGQVVATGISIYSTQEANDIAVSLRKDTGDMLIAWTKDSPFDRIYGVFRRKGVWGSVQELLGETGIETGGHAASYDDTNDPRYALVQYNYRFPAPYGVGVKRVFIPGTYLEALAASLGFSGALVKLTSIPLSGTLTMVGSLTGSLVKILQVYAHKILQLLTVADISQGLQATLSSLHKIVTIAPITQGVDATLPGGHKIITVEVVLPRVSEKVGTDVLIRGTFTDKAGALYDPDVGTIKMFVKKPDGTYYTGFDPTTETGTAMSKISTGVYEANFQSALSDPAGLWTFEVQGKVGTLKSYNDVKVLFRT